MVDTKRFNEADFINGNCDYVDFVRIASHPDKIKETLRTAELLFDRNYNVMIQLMDITNLTQEHYSLLEQWKHKNTIDTLYLADTYGIAAPEDIEKIYNRITKIGYKSVGFHAHNQTKQALENSLKTIELGAYSIDVTQEEAGINGGNLFYKELFDKISANI